MNFIFDKNLFLTHNGYKNLDKSSLKGSHPIFVFLAKENKETNQLNVNYFDWYMTSSVRKQSMNDAFTIVERYNPEWVMRNELSEKVKTTTTHIITGYYDLINDKWIETKITKIEKLTPENIFIEMKNNLFKSINEMYSSKELFLENLKIAKSNEYFSSKINHLFNLDNAVDLIINWYENDVEGVKENFKKDGFVLAPYKFFYEEMKKNNIPEIDSLSGESSLNVLFNTLMVVDILEYGFYNKKEEKFFGKNDKKIGLNENNVDDYVIVYYFREKFENLFKRAF